jgi:hypothetical protein
MSATTLTTSPGDTVTPPRAAVDTARALLSFAKCFGARDGHEVYLSAPITTGEAYVIWRNTHGSELTHDDPGYKSLHYENVVSTNLMRVAPLVAQLRRRFPERLVIDPTSLADLPGWEQTDYHEFWCHLIERYAALVIFADGWQFSTGCVREFATAIQGKIKTVDQSLAPLTLRDGISLISAAIVEFDRLHVDSSRLRQGLTAAERAKTA